jgi:hypothetical protein
MELFRFRTPDGTHQVEVLLDHKHGEALSKILLKLPTSAAELRRELTNLLSSFVVKDEGRFTEKENVFAQETKRQPPRRDRSHGGAGSSRDKPYFWSLDERVEFIKLLHKYGKKWI